MKNSTEHLLKTKSDNLKKISVSNTFRSCSINPNSFLNHDLNNLYRTSYNDMYNKVIKIINLKINKIIGP